MSSHDHRQGNIRASRPNTPNEQICEITADSAKDLIEKILLEEIDLARPDDLAFLEWKVPSIAGRIVGCLGLRDDRK